MAGMLYLPRLFVYHGEGEVGSKQSETFKVMERRLLKAIINPAMIVTWLAGLYLAWAGHWLSAGRVAWKIAAGAAAVGRPRFFCPLREGFCGRPESEVTEILSWYQRGTNRLDDRDRYPGSG